jgi:hypothetical protein
VKFSLKVCVEFTECFIFSNNLSHKNDYSISLISRCESEVIEEIVWEDTWSIEFYSSDCF